MCIRDRFDEQPSDRDVYEHRIPWLYTRYVEGLTVEGIYEIDPSLEGYVDSEEILEESSRISIKR